MQAEVLEANLPAAQASQFESPALDWKRPAAQDVQTVAAAAADTLPWGQLGQVEAFPIE